MVCVSRGCGNRAHLTCSGLAWVIPNQNTKPKYQNSLKMPPLLQLRWRSIYPQVMGLFESSLSGFFSPFSTHVSLYKYYFIIQLLKWCEVRKAVIDTMKLVLFSQLLTFGLRFSIQRGSVAPIIVPSISPSTVKPGSNVNTAAIRASEGGCALSLKLHSLPEVECSVRRLVFGFFLVLSEADYADILMYIAIMSRKGRRIGQLG